MRATIRRTDVGPTHPHSIVKQWNADDETEAQDVFDCMREQENDVAAKYRLKPIPLTLEIEAR